MENSLKEMVQEELSKREMKLPMPEQVASSLSELMDDENVGVDEVSEVIAKESNGYGADASHV